MVTVWTGADAWRNQFSVDAADLLQIMRWAAQWNTATFTTVLMMCFRRSRGERVNTRTVERVLALMMAEGFLTVPDRER